jgi:Tfp pilus assembly protein PilX
MITNKRYQFGATLFTSMIILVLLTMLVVGMFYYSKSNLQIVANMQQRGEALDAAQSVVERAISSSTFFTSPTAVFTSTCTTANTLCIDTNGDGIQDITVTLTPTPSCKRIQALQNAALDLSNTEDLGCVVGVQQNFGVVGASSDASMCANSLWEVSALANDAITQSQASVTQGIAVRIAADDASASCP